MRWLTVKCLYIATVTSTSSLLHYPDTRLLFSTCARPKFLMNVLMSSELAPICSGMSFCCLYKITTAPNAYQRSRLSSSNIGLTFTYKYSLTFLPSQSYVCFSQDSERPGGWIRPLWYHLSQSDPGFGRLTLLKLIIGLQLARLADLPRDVLTHAGEIARGLSDESARRHESSESYKVARRRKTVLRVCDIWHRSVSLFLTLICLSLSDENNVNASFWAFKTPRPRVPCLFDRLAGKIDKGTCR